jgi:hypothetical protein
MRKVLALPLLALAVVLPTGLATAAPDDVNGPACADIIDSDWVYSSDGSEATAILFLDTASCPSVTYTLVVQDSDTETAIQATAAASGDRTADNASGPGTDSVTLSATVAVPDRDTEVCLYATTSIGMHVFDRAPDADGVSTLPDADCVELIPGGTGGASGFG